MRLGKKGGEGEEGGVIDHAWLFFGLWPGRAPPTVALAHNPSSRQHHEVSLALLQICCPEREAAKTERQDVAKEGDLPDASNLMERQAG
jgi:hypothetical protein